jgi:hypothetical protein
MVTNFYNKKFIYLLVITFLGGFLCACLIFWHLSSEQKIRFMGIKSSKPFYQPQKLPERTLTQRGTLFSNRLVSGTPLVKKDIKGPVQGKVTIIDWCSRTVFINDVLFNMGNIDLVGVIEMGDRVEVTYTDTKQGKVIESIQVLH